MMGYTDLVNDIETLSTYVSDGYTKAVLRRAAYAIEELQQIAAHYEETAKDYFKDVCYYLERVPKWIPVTERLPESVCKSYLCLTDTGYICEVRWTNNVYGLWKSDNKWGWSIADVPQYTKVTHWMPLPKTPKEETE